MDNSHLFAAVFVTKWTCQHLILHYDVSMFSLQYVNHDKTRKAKEEFHIPSVCVQFAANISYYRGNLILCLLFDWSQWVLFKICKLHSINNVYITWKKATNLA